MLVARMKPRQAGLPASGEQSTGVATGELAGHNY